MNADYEMQTPTTVEPHLPLAAQPLGGPTPDQFHSVEAHDQACAERRRKARMAVQMTAQVRGITGEGVKFEATDDAAQLQDLSASGLRLHLKHQVEAGQRLFILFPVALSMAAGIASPSTFSPAPRTSIAVIGIVRRAEAHAEAGCSVGVEIVRHRFIYGGDNGPTRPHSFLA